MVQGEYASSCACFGESISFMCMCKASINAGSCCKTPDMNAAAQHRFHMTVTPGTQAVMPAWDAQQKTRSCDVAAPVIFCQQGGNAGVLVL